MSKDLPYIAHWWEYVGGTERLCALFAARGYREEGLVVPSVWKLVGPVDLRHGPDWGCRQLLYVHRTSLNEMLLKLEADMKAFFGNRYVDLWNREIALGRMQSWTTFRGSHYARGARP